MEDLRCHSNRNPTSSPCIRIVSVLPERILRENLLTDTVLNHLLILRRPSATNFKLTDEEAAELHRLVGS